MDELVELEIVASWKKINRKKKISTIEHTRTGGVRLGTEGTPFGLRCTIGGLTENISNDCGCNEVGGFILVVGGFELLFRCAWCG